MDNDGYPDDEDLKRVREWDVRDLRGLFDFLRDRWHFSDWGWTEGDEVDPIHGPVHEYHISTGGWSGNESLIDELRNNWLIWSLTWVSSRRGGHYVFQVKR